MRIDSVASEQSARNCHHFQSSAEAIVYRTSWPRSILQWPEDACFRSNGHRKVVGYIRIRDESRCEKVGSFPREFQKNIGSRTWVSGGGCTTCTAEGITDVFSSFFLFNSVRALGSAALNMAMVALGAADVNFEYGIHAWDIAAGDLIVREAGGVVVDPAGGPLDLMSRRVLAAATPELANEFAKMLTQYYPEPRD